MVLRRILAKFGFVKQNLTIRQGILLLLLLFGLIIGGLAFFSFRYARNRFVKSEYEGARDNLSILALQIEMNLRANSEHPFSFLETVSTVQSSQQNFSFLVRDSAGTVLAPAFAAGKELPMAILRRLTPDGNAMVADVWGYECFVVTYPIPGRPLEMLAIYDNDYMFEDDQHTLHMFILAMSVIYLILVLQAWFWIIPALERTLEEKHQVESELNSARELQRKAVSTEFPPHPDCDMYAVLQPAREVGGDIYRCGVLDGDLHFLIGDVSDKGLPAALLMFTISSYIHSRGHDGLTPAELMKELNDLICDNSEYEMFCTIFGGCIDLKTKKMTYCNAGHTKTIVDGAFLDQDPQLIAGIRNDYPYHEQTLQLHSGSRLLLYTDGVTEARSETRAFFGEARLLSWMQARPAGETCQDTCNALLDELARFRGKAVQNDDIAIICVKI